MGNLKDLENWVKKNKYMNGNYEITIGSPTDYNELVAYIWLNREQIAIVHKEEGPDKIIVEFFEEPIGSKIYIDSFIKALNLAKEELLR